MENQIRPFSYNTLAIGSVQIGIDYGLDKQSAQVKSDWIYSILDIAFKNNINIWKTNTYAFFYKKINTVS